MYSHDGCTIYSIMQSSIFACWCYVLLVFLGYFPGFSWMHHFLHEHKERWCKFIQCFQYVLICIWKKVISCEYCLLHEWIAPWNKLNTVYSSLSVNTIASLSNVFVCLDLHWGENNVISMFSCKYIFFPYVSEEHQEINKTHFSIVLNISWPALPRK